MSDILDKEYNISSYINKSIDNKESDYSKIDRAIKYQESEGSVMIIPTDSIHDLEDQWIKFNSMIKHHRRESDWESLDIFGMTNQEHYELLRSKLLKNDDDISDYHDKEKAIEADDIPVSESYLTPNLDMYYDSEGLSYTSEDIDKAIKWSSESNRIIIVPTRTLQELESLWAAFNSMLLKHRRESDWMSEEIFGVTNLRHYEYLKYAFLRDDIDNHYQNFGESSIIVGDSQALSKSYIKRECGKLPGVDIAKLLLEMSLPKQGIYEELITNNVISDVMDTYNDLTSDIPTMDIYSSGDIPYFDPEDMIDMGVFGNAPVDNFYDAIPDNTMLNEEITVKEWFEIYRAHLDGAFTEFSKLSSDWLNKVRELTFGLKRIQESGDQQAINARKQSILELGWNPDVEFNVRNRMIAKETYISREQSRIGTTRFIDLKSFDASDQLAFYESDFQNPLKPIFIVLTEGGNAFSDVIKAWTHSIYSHASIAFDYTLRKMYSFGIIDSPNGNKGGFLEEDVEKTPVGKRIGVFAFFVSDKIYNTIKSAIEVLKLNVKNTKYSYTGVVGLALGHPENNKDTKLFCSQFVDRTLKSVGIDITNKNSGLVSPADIANAAKKERKIYTIYEGLASKYNASKIHNTISSLLNRAKAIKEASPAIYNDEKSYVVAVINNIHSIPVLLEMETHIDMVSDKLIRQVLESMVFEPLKIEPYCEAKEFPVQFDKEGNLLLKNLKKIDYEAEYAKSHKLLKQYQISGNIDGMKYELSKLWMMCCLIEEKIYAGKMDIQAGNKARAKILNDFKFYLNKVIEKEPAFNFSEYYEESPFSSSTTKVNNTTMVFLGKLIKKFIKSI